MPTKSYKNYSKPQVEEEVKEEVVKEAPKKKEPNYTKAIVIANRLNVRSNPVKNDGNVLMIVDEGTKIKVMKSYTDDVWAFVEVKQGAFTAKGYVMKKFIKEV